MSPDSNGAHKALSRQADVESRLSDYHYAIFELLPVEGQKLGYHPMVVTVPYMRDKLNAALPAGQPKLTSGSLMAELRELCKFGLTLRVTTLAGSTMGWQKTQRAAELLAAHQTTTTNRQQVLEGERA